eukprot:TRINITY_DN2446_c0_g1_i1.p1 TRINITY_DN2446_c0_g1~~TRINITY_DN2446_c0_g1_i1.p1  ORF type:complete len:515 (+),score=297.98 TRINITY_DN2446_c0_g1_i1:56-1546(+)
MPVGLAEPKPVQPKRRLVPEDPNAPKRPDHSAMIKEVESVRADIEKLKAEIDTIKAEQDALRNDKDDPRKELRNERTSYIEQKKKVMDAVQKLRQDQSEIYNASRNIREKNREAERDVRALHKELGDILTPEALEKKIKELEFKLETGGAGGTKGERKVIQEIRNLKDKRGKVDEIYKKLSGMELVKEEGVQEDEKKGDLKAQIDAKRDEIAVLIQKIQDVELRIQTTQVVDKYGELKVKREGINKQMDGKFEKIRQIRDKFTADKKKYDDYQVEFRKKLDAAREAQRKEREAENLKRDEERKAKELELASIHRRDPYEAEIKAAETLIGYLKGKAAFSQKDERKAPVAPAGPAFDASAAIEGKKVQGKVMQVLKREEDDQSLFFGKKKKAPAPKPAAKKAEAAEVKVSKVSKPLKIGTEKFAAFDFVGVKVPVTTDDVKATVDQLREKKTHWESFRKTEKEAMAEEQAERKQKEQAAEEARAKEEAAAPAADEEE